MTCLGAGVATRTPCWHMLPMSIRNFMYPMFRSAHDPARVVNLGYKFGYRHQFALVSASYAKLQVKWV
jgi:hypothetical protein